MPTKKHAPHHRCSACGARTYRKTRVTLDGKLDERCARCARRGHWPKASHNAYGHPIKE